MRHIHHTPSTLSSGGRPAEARSTDIATVSDEELQQTRAIFVDLVAEGRVLDPVSELDRMHARGIISAMLELIDEVLRLRAAIAVQPGPVSMDDVEWAGRVHLADCEARNQKLQAACTALAALVQRDRVALYEAHRNPVTGEVEADGQAGLDEYDAALALADQAMAVEGTERGR